MDLYEDTYCLDCNFLVCSVCGECLNEDCKENNHHYSLDGIGKQIITCNFLFGTNE